MDIPQRLKDNLAAIKLIEMELQTLRRQLWLACGGITDFALQKRFPFFRRVR